MFYRTVGFSLTECLLALAVLAIVTVGSTPYLGRLMAESRLISSSNTLLVALQHARATAWSRNEPWILCLTDDGKRCKTGRAGAARGWLVRPLIEVAEVLANPATRAGLPALQASLLSEDIVVHGTRLAITYWPTSRSGTTATLTLCSNLRELAARQVVISQTGRPRLQTAPRAAACAAL